MGRSKIINIYNYFIDINKGNKSIYCNDFRYYT